MRDLARESRPPDDCDDPLIRPHPTDCRSSGMSVVRRYTLLIVAVSSATSLSAPNLLSAQRGPAPPSRTDPGPYGAPRVPVHRPARQSRERRGRYCRRSARLLPRRRFRWNLEDGRRWRALAARLRQPTCIEHRRDLGGAVRSECRMGRNRREHDPEPHLDGVGDVPVH